jgi:hypothetical protein
VDWHCRFCFCLVPNGQETKYHFTINNSPLPSNVINDVAINNLTGEVLLLPDCLFQRDCNDSK